MGLGSHSLVVLLVFSCSLSLSFAIEQGIACLKSIKASLEDPFNYLNSSWNFNNQTEGYIFKFVGVECWHPDENKVLNLRLDDMGLKGKFPLGIGNCSSMTGLDLSSNKLYGELPENISYIVGYLTSLDLSSNNFSGKIPDNLAIITYLNTLKLDHNQFTGQTPAQLGRPARLKMFSIANNLLTGPIPSFEPYKALAENFANNQGLCGVPLYPCQGTSKGPHAGVIAVAAIAGVTVAALVVVIGMFFNSRKMSVKKKKKDDDPEGNKWAKNLKGPIGIKVSLFEESVTKMGLSDLMKATVNFNKSSIIRLGRTGTMYKAVLEDGTPLMVKRLQDSQHSEKRICI